MRQLQQMPAVVERQLAIGLIVIEPVAVGVFLRKSDCLCVGGGQKKANGFIDQPLTALKLVENFVFKTLNGHNLDNAGFFPELAHSRLPVALPRI